MDAAREPTSVGLVPDSTFGRYRLLRPIGTGGMGSVWEAFDPMLGRNVALKMVRADLNRNPEAVMRFLREGRLAARLQHPGIVAVHDVGTEQAIPYLAMELVRGETMDDWLKQTGPDKRAGRLPPLVRLQQEIALLAEAAEAVGYAHSHGVIHRDLKPGNILLAVSADDATSLHAEVMDFGLARESASVADTPPSDLSRITLSGQVLGTPAYMSPEQANGDAALVGPRADVWALGASLYELLTGRLPFYRDSTMEVLAAILFDDPTPPRKHVRGLPEELELICLKAMEKSPPQRYGTGAEFAADLRRWLNGEPVTARRTTGWQRAGRWLRRQSVAVLLTLAVVFLISGALAWARFERAQARQRAMGRLDAAVAAVQAMQVSLQQTLVPKEARIELSRGPLTTLDPLIAAAPDLGLAYAWRGHVMQLLTEDRAAAADYDLACRLSPEYATVWFLRATYRLDLYARSRGVPMVRLTSMGPILDPLGPETAAERDLREAALTDLDRVGRSEVWHNTPTAPEMQVAKAMTVFYTERPDRFEATLSLLAGADGARASQLRGMCHFNLFQFEAAEEELSRFVAQWPADSDGRFWRSMTRQALGMKVRTQGQDPRAVFQQAIADQNLIVAANPEQSACRNNRGILWRNLGHESEAHGVNPEEEYAQAIADFTAAIDGAENVAYYYSNRGMSWLNLSEFREQVGRPDGGALERGLADAEAAVRLDRNLTDGYIVRGWAKRLAGERSGLVGDDPLPAITGAQVDMEQAARLQPDDPEVALNLLLTIYVRANWLVRTGRTAAADIDRAEQLAHTVIAGRREFAEAWKARARIRMLRVVDPDTSAAVREQAILDGLADAEETVRRAPRSSTAHCTRGELLLALGDDLDQMRGDPLPTLTRALADADEALRLEPDLLQGLDLRGRVLAQLASAALRRGEDARPWLERSRADLDRQVACLPESGFAYAHRGKLLGLAGQADIGGGRDPLPHLRAARADLERAVERNPNLIDAWRDLGFARMQVIEYEVEQGVPPPDAYQPALAALERAISLGPGRMQSWQNLGILLRHVGDAEESHAGDGRPPLTRAIAAFDRSLALAPERADGYANRGVARSNLFEAMRGRGQVDTPLFEAAEADFREAIRRNEPSAWINLAQHYEQVGWLFDAEQCLQRARVASPALEARAQRRLDRIARWLQPAWNHDWFEGLSRMRQKEYAAALALLDRGRTAFLAAVAAATDPAEAARLHKGAFLHSRACYSIACLEVRAECGGLDAGGTGAAPDPRTSAEHREVAIARLAEAIRLDAALAADAWRDHDLAPLIADPRWPALVGRAPPATDGKQR